MPFWHFGLLESTINKSYYYYYNLDENFLTAGIQIGDIHVMSIYVHPSTSLCDRKEFVTTLTKFLEHKEKWITSGDLND